MTDHLLSIVLLSPFPRRAGPAARPYGRTARCARWPSASPFPPLVISVRCCCGSTTRPAGGFQFLETYPVIPDLGIQYHLAVDGLSLALVLLTAFIYLTGITTTWYLKKREKEFFLFLALLVTGVFGVFVPRWTCSCSSCSTSSPCCRCTC